MFEIRITAAEDRASLRRRNKLPSRRSSREDTRRPFQASARNARARPSSPSPHFLKEIRFARTDPRAGLPDRAGSDPVQAPSMPSAQADGLSARQQQSLSDDLHIGDVARRLPPPDTPSSYRPRNSR